MGNQDDFSSISKTNLKNLIPHFVILGLLCFTVYSNNYQHSYNLDSGHVILENPYVRSLTYIPQYFVDAGTSSILNPNIDYRPILNISHALNYRMGGYDTWWWHFTQIFLHLCCCIGLYFLCKKISEEFFVSEDKYFFIYSPLIVSAIFAVHPYATGVVNYLSARSSLLTAAFLFPSILLFMTPTGGKQYCKTPWAAALFYFLALFTKVEAVAALGVYLLYEVLQTSKQNKDKKNFFSDLLNTINLNTLFRTYLFFIITIIYFIIRHFVMSDYDNSARHAADVGSYEYLLTQLTAWWHYILRWFAPINLIADDLTFPVFKSISETSVLLALSGWLLVLIFLLFLWTKHPHIVFLALSGFFLITPTSSIVPLSEMVNEHRPYMPLAVLSLSWLIPLNYFWFRQINKIRTLKYLSVAAFTFLVLTFSIMTYQRNLIFKTEKSYWEDVVKKAPSSRSYVNFGLALMAEANYDSAYIYFQKSLELAPYWHIPHINIAIVYQHYEDDSSALYHFDRAVEYEQFSGQAFLYRGNFFLKKKDYKTALKDFTASTALNRNFFDIYKGIATAYAGLGLPNECMKYTNKCIQLDSLQTLDQIVPISTPFWDDENLYQQGIIYYELLDKVIPHQWWIYDNIANLASMTNNNDLAEEYFKLSEKMK